MSKGSFEQMYGRLLRSLERRAKVVAAEGRRARERQEMVNELGLLAAHGIALAKSGQEKEARKVLRKAEILEAKLRASRSKR